MAHVYDLRRRESGNSLHTRDLARRRLIDPTGEWHVIVRRELVATAATLSGRGDRGREVDESKQQRLHILNRAAKPHSKGGWKTKGGRSSHSLSLCV